jgi:hypothetical protein
MPFNAGEVSVEGIKPSGEHVPGATQLPASQVKRCAENDESMIQSGLGVQLERHELPRETGVVHPGVVQFWLHCVDHWVWQKSGFELMHDAGGPEGAACTAPFPQSAATEHAPPQVVHLRWQTLLRNAGSTTQPASAKHPGLQIISASR